MSVTADTSTLKGTPGCVRGGRARGALESGHGFACSGCTCFTSLEPPMPESQARKINEPGCSHSAYRFGSFSSHQAEGKLVAPEMVTQ